MPFFEELSKEIQESGICEAMPVIPSKRKQATDGDLSKLKKARRNVLAFHKMKSSTAQDSDSNRKVEGRLSQHKNKQRSSKEEKQKLKEFISNLIKSLTGVDLAADTTIDQLATKMAESRKVNQSVANTEFNNQLTEGDQKYANLDDKYRSHATLMNELSATVVGNATSIVPISKSETSITYEVLHSNV